jgi:hypothetical protein
LGFVGPVLDSVKAERIFQHCANALASGALASLAAEIEQATG